MKFINENYDMKVIHASFARASLFRTFATIVALTVGGKCYNPCNPTHIRAKYMDFYRLGLVDMAANALLA